MFYELSDKEKAAVKMAFHKAGVRLVTEDIAEYYENGTVSIQEIDGRKAAVLEWEKKTIRIDVDYLEQF